VSRVRRDVRRRLGVVALAGSLWACGGGGPAEPPGPPLVSVTDLDPSIRLDMRYAGPDNFVGAPVAGYEAPLCWLAEPAARALVAVQADLAAQGLGLLVFDCYRPQRAVDQFVRWAADASDQRTKAEYYPGVAKEELVSRGYIAARSAHSRGSAVDLTLTRADSWGGAAPLDMGTPFDFFDERSRSDSREVSEEARENRRLLRAAMERRGFRNLPQEWWHFTLAGEPYPDKSFDVPVR
jgi:D-alanyl-D-alanine dipeptidase